MDGKDLKANKPDVHLAYNSKENVAVLTTKDGGFDLEDYGKKAFQRSAGQRDSRISLTSVTVHPGKVSDTSFIPAEAESFCFNGYQWITIGQQTADSGHGRSCGIRYFVYSKLASSLATTKVTMH
ncbi:hypothetical protein EB796_024973 [Bugula neritina]|uniref:Uncharacterized protein n=1 Tax=Bugula neritina TaxID=10212 RepID=A0A7J7IT53_BUGNE|nr:hypothetical protein EB796_024973 [Bugula neritina]